ncbi:hypothetical protein QJS10_CPA09g01227 [Acorus calamus]|uniref:PGG domain-containing protein n=1 Tax=Acorus calamus TaxID=4465 RepID=A0AAV9E565_ACOCL|nr:hypothetical protein QJS10_CPA09g01227 [Acorus calamus]
MMAGQLSFNFSSFFILERGVDPAGNSALHVAVMRGEEGIVKELLQKKPELNNLKDASGNTPLHYGAGYGDIHIVRCILNVNKDVDKDGGYLLKGDGHSPLHMAAGCGNRAIVEALVEEYKGCFMLKDNKRRNALHLAVEGGHYGVFKDMLRSPFSAWLRRDRDCDGNTPLHLAAIRGRNSMVHHLTSVESKAPSLRQVERMAQAFTTSKGDVEVVTSRKLDAGGCGGRDEEEEGRHQVQSLEKLANNLLLVATLIITVTFAAIITVPGGFESDKGTAGWRRERRSKRS